MIVPVARCRAAPPIMSSRADIFAILIVGGSLCTRRMRNLDRARRAGGECRADVAAAMRARRCAAIADRCGLRPHALRLDRGHCRHPASAATRVDAAIDCMLRELAARRLYHDIGGRLRRQRNSEGRQCPGPLRGLGAPAGRRPVRLHGMRRASGAAGDRGARRRSFPAARDGLYFYGARHRCRACAGSSRRWASRCEPAGAESSG